MFHLFPCFHPNFLKIHLCLSDWTIFSYRWPRSIYFFLFRPLVHMAVKPTPDLRRIAWMERSPPSHVQLKILHCPFCAEFPSSLFPHIHLLPFSSSPLAFLLRFMCYSESSVSSPCSFDVFSMKLISLSSLAPKLFYFSHPLHAHFYFSPLRPKLICNHVLLHLRLHMAFHFPTLLSGLLSCT